MIICRLQELATAKNLNISQVQKQTGLDLGLVRRYWYDDTESFKRDAINKLCILLQCHPGDLLVFKATGSADAILAPLTADATGTVKDAPSG